MRLTNSTSRRNVGVGVVALFLGLPLIYADRQQSSDRSDPGDHSDDARHEPATRVEPRRGPIERGPAVVDRSNHGSIRHVDTHVVERPVAGHRDFDPQQRGIVHHDVDVDLGRSRFWHGFVFGARQHALRNGYLRVYVGSSPYFYDDGIYYQQLGEDYQVVYPPVGVLIPELPDGTIEISTSNGIYYYVAGAFYVQQAGGFVIAVPPMGAVVPELPPGTVSVIVNGRVAYQFNGVYYQPVFVNGVTQYLTFRP